MCFCLPRRLLPPPSPPPPRRGKKVPRAWRAAGPCRYEWRAAGPCRYEWRAAGSCRNEWRAAGPCRLGSLNGEFQVADKEPPSGLCCAKAIYACAPILGTLTHLEGSGPPEPKTKKCDLLSGQRPLATCCRSRPPTSSAPWAALHAGYPEGPRPPVLPLSPPGEERPLGCAPRRVDLGNLPFPEPLRG